MHGWMGGWVKAITYSVSCLLSLSSSAFMPRPATRLLLEEE